jgi:hypothetical protein
MTTTISGSNGIVFPDSTSMQTGQQACKAWVNFNGTGTVAIRAAYNVSSITDNGTGQFQINFTTNMVDVNYATTLTCMDYSFGSVISIKTTLADYTTSSFKVLTLAKDVNSFFDPAIVCASIFR